MPNVRVTQSCVELIVLTDPNVRVNQSCVEFLTFPIPPVITCGNPPPGQVQTAYTHTFPASGGLAPYTFSLFSGSFPPGLTLNAATGVVSGIPSAAGSFSFMLLITDSNLAVDSIECSIVIVGVVKITFRGVKRVRCDPAEPSASEVPVLPSVKRAM